MTTASADDGEKTKKLMSHNLDTHLLTVTPAEVGLDVAEAEHAVIDMMQFYVPMQRASGSIDETDETNSGLLGEYIDADGNPVETLGMAKPLVGVFLYGPAIGVEGTAFSHSFMDAFAAVSLDDGVTWKKTNLSQTADQSSFRLGQSGGGQHANDNDDHDDDDSHHQTVGPTILEAKWDDEKGGYLEAKGKDAPSKASIEIINQLTKEVLAKTNADKDGEWEIEAKIGDAPCVIAAVADGVQGPGMVPENTPEDCDGGHIVDYPGGVHNIFHATAGNKVLVAWPSRYCKEGKPAYALTSDPTNAANLAELDDVVKFIHDGDEYVLGLEGFSMLDDLYLVDAFGVAGSQKSSDFADEGYPQVGQVPYGCVWTARGVLLTGDDPRTDETESAHMVWTKPERLTSGRRDPFRIEVKAVLDTDGPTEGGFAITWQEDPDGLRPGQGLGPGEGWSGAVAHNKTDIWYSFINMEYFDYVKSEVTEGEVYTTSVPINIVDHDLALGGRPKVFVPMAVPMRLTNNDKCKIEEGNLVDTALYCHFEPYDFGDGIVMAAKEYGLKDNCQNMVPIMTGPDKTRESQICVSEDGLPNIANTGSTRPRLSVQESDTGSAWVVVAAEESKGLGAFYLTEAGLPCDDANADDCDEHAEIGKNQWYFSFDMGTPDTSADTSDTSLVKNLVSQGNMLNQPEFYWLDGTMLPTLNTSTLWGFGEFDYEIYNTEIARRSSLLVQSTDKAGDSGLLAISSWKQGPMRQGGPSDTMMRRFVDQDTSLNPYAFTNMVCDNWGYPTGAYYPDGVCLDPAVNLSSVTPDTCIDSEFGGEEPCPTVTNGVGDTNPILQGYIQGEGNKTKVLTWHQCPSDSGADMCADGETNLQDQSWYNPLDVSKGHRGFLNGDMVMFMYAWSPNWRLNAKGHDRYDLYVRRSFDGGVTWTTTPGDLGGDGTVTCETYRDSDTQVGGEVDEPQVCYTFAAGAAEHARNVTQHSRRKITTLDPRYAPTMASIEDDCLDGLDLAAVTGFACDDGSTEYDSDANDPSRFFMVYETGDNTTVEVGEAEPLDLFYSRAINYGDDYVVWAENDGSTADQGGLAFCYPSDPHDDDKLTDSVVVGSGFCNEFDRMNSGNGTHSSEASLKSNPDGSKLYGVWGQWIFDDLGEEVIEADAMSRRVWWIDDYIPIEAWITGQGTGDGVTAN